MGSSTCASAMAAKNPYSLIRRRCWVVLICLQAPLPGSFETEDARNAGTTQT